jgi:hypothetical protein
MIIYLFLRHCLFPNLMEVINHLKTVESLKNFYHIFLIFLRNYFFQFLMFYINSPSLFFISKFVGVFHFQDLFIYFDSK